MVLQEAIIINGEGQRRENMKIIGFLNYPKFIFKKLVERELKEKSKYGFVLHPVFKKSHYNVKLHKNILPNINKNYFTVNNEGIFLFIDKKKTK